MPTNRPVQIFVEGLSNSGSREDVQSEKNLRVRLHVQYGQKEAQIELPVGAPLFEREPGTEVYRRDLQELIEALEAAVVSPQGILWPSHR
jgi:hypothetical protein